MKTSVKSRELKQWIGNLKPDSIVEAVAISQDGLVKLVPFAICGIQASPTRPGVYQLLVTPHPEIKTP